MKGLLIIPLSFLFLSICAQPSLGLNWKKVFGGKRVERAYDIISTYDGNIALVGETNSTSKKSKNALWMLLDANGHQMKQIQLGGPKEDILKALVQTYDGGYALAGHTESYGQGLQDGWLVKLNEKGDTLWQKSYGDARNEIFNDLIQTHDGGLLAVGSRDVKGGNQKDIWLYATYEDGTIKWQRSFGNRHYDEAKAIVVAGNGNIAIAGSTASGKGKRNIWLFILDKYGNPLHHRIFGERQWEEVFDLVATRDGGFALCGFAKTTQANKGNGLKDAWLIKTAPDGELIWQRTLGGRDNDSVFGITETIDAGFVIVGYTFSHLISANTSNAFLVKVDKHGNTIWEQNSAMGGKGNDRLNAVSILPNGCLIATGTTNSKQENAQQEDIWVMRFNCNIEVNTGTPTQLAITTIEFLDDGDQMLEEQEEAFFYLTLENKGTQHAYDLDFFVQEQTNAKGLQFRAFQKLGFLAAGKTQAIRIPITGLEGIRASDASFDFFVTDASRTQTERINITIPTRPLDLPSNFLDVAWVFPVDSTNILHKSEQIGIRLRARSDQELQRKQFKIFLNDQPYKLGQKAGEASLRSKGKNKEIFTYEYNNQIDLQPGKNTIEVFVEQGSKTVSAQKIDVFYSNKPNLHILAICIDHDDLNFTKKDALDFAQSFNNQEGKLFDKTFLTTLVSGQRNKAGVIQTNGAIIKKNFQDLKDKYNFTVYKQDLLIVFLSSHGKSINNEFKIIPTDFEIVGEQALIDYKKDIIDQLEAINCHKLLFVDACQSGSFSQEAILGNSFDETIEERTNALLQLSASYQNTATLASCQAMESSWEDSSWENGAFTEAIIGALHNESYQDENGTFVVSSDNSIITVGELYQYLQRRVPQMIKEVGKNGTQQPYISRAQLLKIKDLPLFELEK